MRALLRVAATLLLAIPVFLVVLIMFALTARRTSHPGESRDSRSLERGASRGAQRRASMLTAEVSR